MTSEAACRRHLLSRRANCHGFQAVEHVLDIYPRRRLAADNGLAKPRCLRRGLERQTSPRTRLAADKRSRFVARCPDGSGPSSGILLCDFFPRVAAFRPYPGLHSVVPNGDARQTQSAQSEIREDRKERANLLPLTFSLITYFGAGVGRAACRVIHRKRARHIRLRRLRNIALLDLRVRQRIRLPVKSYKDSSLFE